jgi:hypothetical protein
VTRRANTAAGRGFPWEGLDSERRNALFLYAGIGVIVLFAFALIAWGYYSDRIAPNRETVLSVGERKFDLAFLQRRVEADLNTGRAQPTSTLEQVVIASLQSIELEELARQSAAREGLAVTEDDIDKSIKRRVGVPEDAPQNAFAEAYRRDVLRVGLPVSEYRDIIAAQIAQDRLLERYESAVPAEAEQVNAQIIRTADEAAAIAAKKRIDEGENMTATAVTHSIDQSKSNGGQLGWRVREELPDSLVEAFFTLPVDTVSQPIQGDNGWYLVQARGREVRAIDEEHKGNIARTQFSKLVSATRDEVGSVNRLTEDQIARIGRNLLG